MRPARPRAAKAQSSWGAPLIVLVMLGALVPLSLLHRRSGANESKDSSVDSSIDTSQLATLAEMAQQNEQLLRKLAEAESIRATEAVPEHASDALTRPAEAPRIAVAAVPAAVQAQAVPVPTLPTSEVWLRMALMSIGRKDSSLYLLRTLVSILEQLPPHDPLSAHVQVVTINNQEPPEAHTVFARAREQFASHPSARFITKRRPTPGLRCPGAPGKVTANVQRQSCDLVAAINAILDMQPAAAHVMMMEDDWLFCPNGLGSLHYAVNKAYRYDPNWIALRVSYGFNGVVVRQADLPSLQAHLAKHFERRPPDHLLFEWFSGERPDTRQQALGRSYRIYRHNLFFHIGVKSTINQPSHRFIPGCYALLYDWLLPAEVFNEKDCPDDDLWPCKEASRHAPTDFAVPRLVWSSDKLKTPTPLNPLDKPRAAPGESFEGIGMSAAAVVAPSSAAAGAGVGAGAGAQQQQQLAATPIMARRDESCQDACSRQQKRCDAGRVSELNTCESLRRHFDCHQCSNSIGADQPALVAADAPPESLPGACLVNDGPVSCDGSHAMTTRLCACR